MKTLVKSLALEQVHRMRARLLILLLLVLLAAASLAAPMLLFASRSMPALPVVSMEKIQAVLPNAISLTLLGAIESMDFIDK